VALKNKQFNKNEFYEMIISNPFSHYNLASKPGAKLCTKINYQRILNKEVKLEQAEATINRC